MKYAVMVSQTEFPKKNIGDYVQAMAARQYQEECVFVQREKLKSYSGDSVAMIMNGWFRFIQSNFRRPKRLTLFMCLFMPILQTLMQCCPKEDESIS